MQAKLQAAPRFIPLPEVFTSTSLPRLATVNNAAEIFAAAGQTHAAIRANIFKSADRVNSRGEKIPGNGLASTGAIIRRGRKILIDLDRYGGWLAGRTP